MLPLPLHARVLAVRRSPQVLSGGSGSAASGTALGTVAGTPGEVAPGGYRTKRARARPLDGDESAVAGVACPGGSEAECLGAVSVDSLTGCSALTKPLNRNGSRKTRLCD